MTRQLGLHLISKMRHNAALFLLPNEEQKRLSPRLKYGDKINYEALPLDCRISCQEVGGYRQEIYQMCCRHKDFSEMLNIVVIVKANLANNRRCHVVLFSSDLELDAVTLVEYYGLRFQIEFEFRDAKQHFGLSDFRCVSEVAVKNTVALAFFMGNLSSYLLQALRLQFPEAGILDLKSYYRGRRYALETLKYLPDFADDIVCSDILDKVCRLGLIHAPP
jgi:putative transposase